MLNVSNFFILISRAVHYANNTRKDWKLLAGVQLTIAIYKNILYS